MYRAISDVLSADAALTAVREHARRLAALQHTLRQRLDTPLNQHVIVADFDAEKLVLHTDSPVWAAKLRFKIPDILQIIQKHGKISTLRAVRVKVVVTGAGGDGGGKMDTEKSLENPRKHAIMPLSAENARHLRQLARATEDPALAAAMTRLAGHARPRRGG